MAGAKATFNNRWPRGRTIIRLILSSIFVMPRLRKSKRPLDTPTPTPPSDPVQDPTSRRGFRALATTSTAAILSFSSVSSNTRDMPGNGIAVQGRVTGWQTAYRAARMAIEVAKESSDMFLPLKAITSALSVLIKNYDVGGPFTK